MGKVRRVVRNTLSKEFLPPFVGTSVALFGAPAAFIGLLGGHLSLILTSSLAAFSFTVSAFIHRNRWRQRNGFPLLPGGRIRCPCDDYLTRKAAELANDEFGRNTISVVNYEPLRAWNRCILGCLISSTDEFLGYFDVFPLKKSFAELFIQGTVGERDLKPQHIFSNREMRRAKYVYVGGIAAYGSENVSGRFAGSILIWGLLKYLDHFYGNSDAFIFASAATKDGEHVLQTLKVPLISKAANRNDEQDLYGVRMSRQFLLDSLATVPDYTLLCSVDWAPRKLSEAVDPVPRRPKPAEKRRRSKTA
jgi:hypothetical protein